MGPCERRHSGVRLREAPSHRALAPWLHRQPQSKRLQKRRKRTEPRIASRGEVRYSVSRESLVLRASAAMPPTGPAGVRGVMRTARGATLT